LANCLNGVTVQQCTRQYTVVAGDTLMAIGQRCGVSLQVMQFCNPQIQNINFIQIGQMILLP
jgi:LysM repeat protein